jgi:undecaprenyl-diphosphatase
MLGIRPGKKTVIGVTVLIVVAGLGWVAQHKLSFELREVLPREIYRSRQPDATDLVRSVDVAGIKSVVNLRGEKLDADWYIEELEASRELGLERLDIRFESYHWPRRYSLHRLIAFLDSAPRPILLHCHGGTHRAGLASAVSRALEGQPMDAVRGELSDIRTSLRMSNRGFISLFFDLYEAWLEEQGKSHDAESFRFWALTRYAPPPFDADIRVDETSAFGRVQRGAALQFAVSATNLGSESWRIDPTAVRLGVRAFGPHEQPPVDPMQFLTWRGSGTVLALVDGPSMSVGQGQSVEFQVEVQAPDLPGHYFLQVDLVWLNSENDETDWFSELGRPGFLAGMEVVD